jgi:hypothetical protein
MDVMPGQFEAAIKLIHEYPDLEAFECDLAKVRKQKGSPIAFKTAAEVMQAVRMELLSKEEARQLLGLPARPPRWWARLFSGQTESGSV